MVPSAAGLTAKDSQGGQQPVPWHSCATSVVYLLSRFLSYFWFGFTAPIVNLLRQAADWCNYRAGTGQRVYFIVLFKVALFIKRKFLIGSPTERYVILSGNHYRTVPPALLSSSRRAPCSVPAASYFICCRFGGAAWCHRLLPV